MADISQLGNLQPSEPLDLDTYTDAPESVFRLPKKGRYTVRAPEEFPATAFGATKASVLSVQVDPTIVGPTNEGFQVRYAKVSAKPFQRGGMTVSQLGDYLRACGVRGTIPGTPQAQADAVERTAGIVYEVDLDWRAYHAGTRFQLEGMEKFPSDGNGGHQSWIEHSTEKDEEGKPLRLRANVYVRRFVAAS